MTCSHMVIPYEPTTQLNVLPQSTHACSHLTVWTQHCAGDGPVVRAFAEALSCTRLLTSVDLLMGNQVDWLLKLLAAVQACVAMLPSALKIPSLFLHQPCYSRPLPSSAEGTDISRSRKETSR